MSTTTKLVKGSYYEFTFGGITIPSVHDVNPPDEKYETTTHDMAGKGPQHHTKGLLKFGDLVVQRHIVEGQRTVLYRNFQEARETANTSEVKKEAVLAVKNSEDRTIWRIEMTGCWVKEYKTPSLDANKTELMNEQFVISVDSLEQKEG